MKKKRENEKKSEKKNSKVKMGLFITPRGVKKVMLARQELFIPYPYKCLKYSPSPSSLLIDLNVWSLC